MKEEEVLADLKTKKEQVEYLLEKYPHTRDNDFYLQYLWLKIFGGVQNLPFIDWKAIEHLRGAFETISRVRRKIQNEEGRYLPSEHIRREREAKRKIIQENIYKI